MILRVPLRPLPAQTLGVILGEQQTALTLRQLASGLYINVAVENVEIIGLVICQNANRIVRDAYLGFAGDLMFLDLGDEGADPHFSGLGSRFQLYYLSSDELAAIES